MFALASNSVELTNLSTLKTPRNETLRMEAVNPSQRQALVG